MSVRYPEIHVRLVGEDGNAFAILGRVRKALQRGGVSRDEIEAFHTEATSGDYTKLLATVMQWVSTDDDDEGDGFDWLDDEEGDE